jgi:hypothetical protein
MGAGQQANVVVASARGDPRRCIELTVLANRQR